MGILSKFMPRWFASSADEPMGKYDPLHNFWYQPIGARSASGERVGPQTVLGLSAVYACIRNISEDIAKMPIDMNRRLARGRERLPDHPVSYALNVEPNPEMGALSARATIQSHAMGAGNGYAEIVRDGSGRFKELWPIHWSRVEHKRDAADRLYYRVHLDGGRYADFQARDIFHLPGLSEDGVYGHCVSKIGADSFGRAMATQRFGGAFFGNGATFGAVLEYATPLTPTARKELREQLATQHAGAANAFKTYVLEGGKLSSSSIGVSPEEAQLIETAQFTVEDMARWFRCPLNKIQYFLRAQGWSTLEAQNTDYVVDTLLPWAIRWEQEIARKCLLPTERDLYAKHNFNSLMRGDTTARGEWYTKLFRLGVLNRNEIRSLEDMNPVDGGDDYYIEGSNLQIIKPGSNDDEARLTFIRDTVKAFIADGTVSDVIANSTMIGDLVEQSGLPRNTEYKDPWLPVIADNGQMVSGEVIEDEEGDIVGGDVVEPPQPEQPAGEPGNQQQGSDTEPKDGDSGVVVQASQDDQPTQTAATSQVDWFATFEPLIEDAAERLMNAEIRELSKRADKAEADRPRFDAWVRKFYVGHRDYAAKTIAPLARAWESATGCGIDDGLIGALSDLRADTWTSHPSPTQLLETYKTNGVNATRDAIRKGLSRATNS